MHILEKAKIVILSLRTHTGPAPNLLALWTFTNCNSQPQGVSCFNRMALGRGAACLILLDQREAVLAEEGSAAVNGKLVCSIQLCGLLLVDGSVAVLLQLGHQELLEVVALHLLQKHGLLRAKPACAISGR